MASLPPPRGSTAADQSGRSRIPISSPRVVSGCVQGTRAFPHIRGRLAGLGPGERRELSDLHSGHPLGREIVTDALQVL